MKRHSHLSMKKLSLAIALGLIHTTSYAAEPTPQDTQSAETTQSNLAVIEISSDGQTYSVEVDFSDPVSVKQAMDSLIQQAGADASATIIQQFTQQAQSLAQSQGLTFLSPSVDGQTLPVLLDNSNQAQIDLVATQLNSLGLDNSNIESVLTAAGISVESIDTALSTSDTGEVQEDGTQQEQTSADADQPDVGDIEPSAPPTQQLAGATINIGASTPTATVTSELQVVNDQIDVSPQ